MGECGEQEPRGDVPDPAGAAEAEDAAVEAALRELLLVPGADDTAQTRVALISWYRFPRPL